MLPALLLLARGRVALLAAAGVTVAVFTVPMLLGDPDRFFEVLRAAGSIDPQYELGMRDKAPGAHVNPQSVFLPFATEKPFLDGELLFVPEWLARPSHPLILLLGLALPLLAWRGRRVVDLASGLRLLALIFVLRGALDPMSLDYYAAAARGDAGGPGRRGWAARAAPRAVGHRRADARLRRARRQRGGARGQRLAEVPRLHGDGDPAGRRPGARPLQPLAALAGGDQRGEALLLRLGSRLASESQKPTILR